MWLCILCTLAITWGFYEWYRMLKYCLFFCLNSLLELVLLVGSSWTYPRSSKGIEHPLGGKSYFLWRRRWTLLRCRFFLWNKNIGCILQSHRKATHFLPLILYRLDVRLPFSRLRVSLVMSSAWYKSSSARFTVERDRFSSLAMVLIPGQHFPLELDRSRRYM